MENGLEPYQNHQMEYQQPYLFISGIHYETATRHRNGNDISVVERVAHLTVRFSEKGCYPL